MGFLGRRAWLSLVGSGAAATAAGVRVRSARAREGIVAADPRIKHIVVLMLENRWLVVYTRRVGLAQRREQ